MAGIRKVIVIFWTINDPSRLQELNDGVHLCLLEGHSPSLVLLTAQTLSHLVHHSDQFIRCILDLGITTNWEKSDLEPKQGTKYFVMLISTVEERVFLHTYLSKFKEVTVYVLFLSHFPAQLRQQVLSHVASVETLLPCEQPKM